MSLAQGIRKGYKAQRNICVTYAQHTLIEKKQATGYWVSLWSQSTTASAIKIAETIFEILKKTDKSHFFAQMFAYIKKMECTSTYYPKREPFESTVAHSCE